MAQRSSQRGATLVEYSMLVAFVAVACMSALDFLGVGAETKFIRVNESVRTGEYDETAAPPAGGGSTPTTSAPTTTTAPAPTTTTSTTAPSGPTTTTAPARTASATLGSTDSWTTYWGYAWTGSAVLTLRDAGGAPLAGATVTIRLQPDGGAASTVTVTTSANGTATIDVGLYSRYTSDPVRKVDVIVVDVDAGSGTTWDGAASQVTVTAP